MKHKQETGPPVIRFEARLVRNKTGNKPGIQFEVPKAVGTKLRDMVTVEGVINGHPFRAALESNGAGSKSIRVNDAMRRGSRAAVGDTVDLAILGWEAEPKIPSDLRTVFAESTEARALWKDLTLLARLDWIRWIDAAKTPETRERRIRRTVDQLAEGKRRPCCVNFYEYMLQRVREEEA
jgi:hypothetical protein